MYLVTLFHQLVSLPQAKAWLEQQLFIPLLQYDARVRELKVAVQNLNTKKEDVGRKVDEEENRYGRGIPDRVKNWIQEVDEIISEHRHFQNDEPHYLATFDLSGTGGLPNPWERHRLSRKASDITKKVNGLLQRAEQDWLSYWVAPSTAAFLSVVGYEVFPSREEIVKNIEAALEDSNVRMIGLHGLSGVGKTTLVKKVAQEALKVKMFNVVIMANVTRNPDIKKIQGQIADMLGIKLDEESDIARAARIRKSLENDKKSTLIILDDLWAKVDFNMLGIPSENDDGDGVENVKMAIQSDNAEENVEKGQSPNISSDDNQKIHDASNGMKQKDALSHYKGCKVLLISESKQVLLLSHMEGKGKSIFPMQVLRDKEAKKLFKKKAEIGDTNFKFEKLAAQIVEKCEGLPMSIVTTARALKNQSLAVWEDVNQQLEREKFTGAPEFSTKLSYELLENDELKYTFLLCARMGHDALIMDLVKYCIGLGFLQGIHTAREARNRVYALVEKLKESGLLSNSYSNDHFTMQAIVRSAALSIASKEKQVFTMTKRRIDEWPDEDKLKRYAVISLHHCDIEGFPISINCPRLRVFHIENNGPRLKIPNNFFKGMKELKVLILTGFDLSPLPLSIACLKKLRMLCLEQCVLGKKFSIVGKLKNLRILSFSGSDIEKLPSELKQLTKLQILDISHCSKLQEIPSNVINSLTSLEELYMRNTSIQWNIEGQANQNQNASLSELRHLNQLTTLDIQIPNVAHWPNNLFFDKLNSYKIVIGDLNEHLEMDFKMPEKYEASRFLAVRLKVDFDIHSQKGIKMLFDRVENLLLEDLFDVQDIFYRLNLKGFPYLKHLSIVNNSGIQFLIKPEDREQSEEVFPKLESLYLSNLTKMETICSCELSKPSFDKLKVIKIKICGLLKNVFSFSMVKLLTVLETIEVSECNSLKAIVPGGTQSDSKEIEFPKLRSLMLQSLPGFDGFYPISSIEETKELFHKMVVVSKLERMELSMIQVDKIWSDDLPSKSSNFKNLMHLDVNGCSNLEYLLPFSMAESLVNLQSLFVSGCVKMGQIVSQVKGSNVQMKGIFPNLKKIKLSSMKSLTKIWNAKCHPNSFGKLDTLIIEQCDKFVNVFPFRSLCNLRVTNCKSMKEIFDLDARDVTNLQDLHLEALPKLEHVWKRNEDQGRIPNLEKLRKLSVHYCESLEYIFPFSEVMCLPSLETLVVRMCFKLREIVTKGRSSKPSFVFPKLTTIKFSALRRLMSFYPGDYEVSCPELSDLSIERCFRLKPFRKDTANAQTVLFRNEVINNLKSMQIESWHANYMGKANYRRNKLEELCLSRLVNTEILYSFLDSNPNLQSLSLIACSFKEVVPPSRSPGIQNLLGLVPKLKSLKLIDLPKLVEIGFERDIVLLEKIESLVLETCPCLESIISSSVSFTHLTNLEVVNCNGLKYLMPPLTAKSLIHLTTIKVIKCESLKEIVSEQGSEEDGNKDDNIFFRQLKALELVSLKSIESFCSSKSYVFEFPLLENLVVSACPKMKNFSEEVKCTSILQKIYVVHEQQKRCSWHGNLKHTIQKVSEEKKYFEGMEEMSYSEYLELQQAAWHVGVGLQKNWFYSLKTLKLVKCDDIQPYAIPSYILPYLSNLNELEVRDCKKVKVIFEMNDSEIMEAGSQLKKLTLEKLSELKQVWNMHHQGILRRFHENLQQVSVSYCNNLKTLFPLALAKNLKKLEELKIRSCIKLPEIVKKEKTPTEKFVFPCLTMLNLFHLPELSCFYHKTLTLECPALNHLSVKDCGKLELFQSVHPEDEGESSSVSNNRGFLFSDIKAISNLEKLKLCGKRTLELLRSRSTEALIYLNELEVGFDENEPPTFPLEILHKAPDLERMQFSNCNIVEEFLTPDPEIVEHGMLGHLIMLQLYRVSNLHSIGSEKSSWLNTIRDRLNKLYVSDCPHLTEIVHSAVSFSNLKELFIWRCHELKYLFPPATAEKLRNLEVMRVLECKSIKVVVAKEGDQTTSGSIKFERLCSIELNSLSSLECFYSGNDTLVLPSLIVVNIRQCLKMESFSHGSTNAESFRGIFSSVLHEELVLHEDLNGSVKRVLLQRDHLVLGDSPLLEKIWCKLEPDVPHWYFCNLKSLVVEGCDFLSNAILPSHLLRSLSNLEELQVRNCNSVEAIFGAMVNMTPASDPLSFGLKKLILKQLQSLKDIWDKDTQGRLSFPFLEEVLVDGCNSIEYLFPASVAKDTLQKLDVKSCEGLVLISAKDKATTEEAEKELCIFPSLISLRLRDLPNLQQIYPGMHILECPMLKELDVIRCQMLKFFVTNSQTDSHPESQDSSPTDEEQAFVSLQKVTPNLEKLWRTKEDAAMIEQRKLHVDLQRLDSLRLEGFHDESDEFPFVFCSKVPFPSIKKLWVVDSAFKEIFPITKILSRLKGLQHESLSQITSIGFEHPLMGTFLENLIMLFVWRCDCLTNLTPSTVSFSNLTYLSVKDCGKLKYLFTSSTAKTLGVLEHMIVSNCESIEEIVAKDYEDENEGSIIFEQLEVLELSSLPKLQCFYSGSSTLNFPSLNNVYFNQVSNGMNFFRQGYILPNKLVWYTK